VTGGDGIEKERCVFITGEINAEARHDKKIA
jgi:hypothetical protein